MTVIQMSDRELTPLRVMIELADGRLTHAAAQGYMLIRDIIALMRHDGVSHR